MRTLTWMLAASLTVAVVTGVMWADEEKIAIDKLPKAVVDAIKKKYEGAELVSAEKEVEKGKTTFEVDIKYKGTELEVTLTEDGKIVSVEKEIEVKDLPKAVSAAVAAKYKGAKIKKAEEITEGEKVFYEVHLDLGNEKFMEVKLEANGKIVEEEKKDGKDKD